MVTPVTSYRYRAARADGRIASGRLTAPSPTAASALLLERNLHPIALSPSAETSVTGRRASPRDLAVVFRSIASLVAAGVPLERAVASSAALARKQLRELLLLTQQQLAEGSSLAAALESGKGAVPPVIVGMIRAGERGSRLGPALEQAAAHLEQEAELASSLRQALAYPMLLLVTGSISVGVIVTVVVPRFAELLEGSGQALPAATRMLLWVSGLGVRDSGAVVGILVVGVAAFIAWGRGPGRLELGRLLLQLPLIGSIRHALATSRACHALGSTLECGMPALAAIDAAREAAGDVAIAERGGRARERVARGEPLAASLEREQFVTPLAAQLLAVGEGSGRLATMASRAGALSAREAERQLRTALSLLEPALIALFGGVVMLVAIGILQAVYGLRVA